MIETLKDELRQEQIEQEVAKKERPVKTQTRIGTLNKPWLSMVKINRASKAVFQGNYAKLQEYELPSGSTGGETPLTGTVPAGGIANILEMEFTEETEVRIKNTGNGRLNFYLAPDASAAGDGQEVQAQQTVTVTANLLGDINNHFLNVSNAESEEGSYEVLVLV